MPAQEERLPRLTGSRISTGMVIDALSLQLVGEADPVLKRISTLATIIFLFGDPIEDLPPYGLGRSLSIGENDVLQAKAFFEHATKIPHALSCLSLRGKGSSVYINGVLLPLGYDNPLEHATLLTGLANKEELARNKANGRELDVISLGNFAVTGLSKDSAQDVATVMELVLADASRS